MCDLADRVVEIAKDAAREVARDLQRENPKEIGDALAAKIEDRLRFELAGDRAYISRVSRVARKKKQAATADEVRRLFNGKNATEIARSLGIGRATVYRMLKTPG